MRFRSRLTGGLLALSTLVSMTRAQQYCVSGTVSQTHLSKLKPGDPILFTAKVEPGTQCTSAADQTTCSAIVLLEIQSGARRWSSARVNNKAASVQFIFSARDTTTRIILGAVVAPASPSESATPLNMLGVHLGLAYPGNHLVNGALPPALPSPTDHPFEPASIYLAGPGGNTDINYTGQDCAQQCQSRSIRLRYNLRSSDTASHGAFNQTIQWVNPGQEGVIIQHVTIKLHEEDVDNTVLFDGIKEYWEAWSILADGTAPYGLLDHVGWRGEPNAAKGTATVNTSAIFYPCQALPSTFKVDNPDTKAHSLPSTTEDPHLPTKDGSAPVTRTLSSTWP